MQEGWRICGRGSGQAGSGSRSKLSGLGARVTGSHWRLLTRAWQV